MPPIAALLLALFAYAIGYFVGKAAAMREGAGIAAELFDHGAERAEQRARDVRRRAGLMTHAAIQRSARLLALFARRVARHTGGR